MVVASSGFELAVSKRISSSGPFYSGKEVSPYDCLSNLVRIGLFSWFISMKFYKLDKYVHESSTLLAQLFFSVIKLDSLLNSPCDPIVICQAPSIHHFTDSWLTRVVFAALCIFILLWQQCLLLCAFATESFDSDFKRQGISGGQTRLVWSVPDLPQSSVQTL